MSLPLPASRYTRHTTAGVARTKAERYWRAANGAVTTLIAPVIHPLSRVPWRHSDTLSRPIAHSSLTTSLITKLISIRGHLGQPSVHAKYRSARDTTHPPGSNHTHTWIASHSSHHPPLPRSKSLYLAHARPFRMPYRVCQVARRNDAAPRARRRRPRTGGETTTTMATHAAKYVALGTCLHPSACMPQTPLPRNAGAPAQGRPTAPSHVSRRALAAGGP